MYLVSGVATMLVSWGAYAACKLFLDVYDMRQMTVAVILRFLAGVCCAYILNRKIVFCSRNPRVLREFSQFVLMRLFTLFLDMLVMWVLPMGFGWNDWAATLVSQVMVTIGNYLLGKFVIFAKAN